MRLISSTDMTVGYKIVFPGFWFGGIGLVTLGMIPGIIEGRVPALTILIPLGMMALVYVLMRFLVFSCMDEVWLDETDVLVRKSGKQERIPLLNILDVRSKWYQNPECIVLLLKEPCRFGQKISFFAPFRWIRLSHHPLQEELTRMVMGSRNEAKPAT